VWVNRPRHEADHSSASSGEVQNEWLYEYIPPFALMACTVAASLCFTVINIPSLLKLSLMYVKPLFISHHLYVCII
jgi:hypothetical protein